MAAVACLATATDFAGDVAVENHRVEAEAGLHLGCPSLNFLRSDGKRSY